MTKPKQVDILEKCQAEIRNGWYPAPQAHLPAEIRQALRRYGIRPAVGMCHRNSQRFMMDSDYEDPALAARLTYCEGFASSGQSIWFQHAWLLIDGAMLDLTLEPDPAHEYIRRYTATVMEIARYLFAVKSYTWVKLGENERVDDVSRALGTPTSALAAKRCPMRQT